jgi:hypothetical protein
VSPYILHHAYVKEGDPAPSGLGDFDLDFDRMHVESEPEGTALHIWWFAWDE